MKHFFFGGVHPAGRKELTADSLPVPAPVPKHVVLPMLQHIGALCTPLVQVGDRVKLGQKIGDGEGLCVPVHASVSGTVVAVEPRPHPNGTRVLSVVIESDGKDTLDENHIPHPDPDSLTDEQVVSLLGEAGLVGMGGATFPTDIKTLSAMGKVDTVIVNACECEPYITADDVLLRTQPDHVILGLKLLRRVLQPQRAVIALEDNKQEAIRVLQDKLKTEQELELLVLPTRYPQGSEKQLIQAVTGRQVPPGGLPAAVGCAVFNTATSAAAYRAVYLGQPVYERIITVTGEGVRSPRNLLVRMGTSFGDLINAAGGLTDDACKVLSGGPMMGIAQKDLTAPALKGTNCVLCLKDAKWEKPTTACIRCGKCVGVCPMHLQPLYLYRYEAAGDLAELTRLNLTDCMECGSCTYVCPAGLPLVERFRAGKKALREATKQ